MQMRLFTNPSTISNSGSPHEGSSGSITLRFWLRTLSCPSQAFFSCNFVVDIVLYGKVRRSLCKDLTSSI
jgi:hypothetical protein